MAIERNTYTDILFDALMAAGCTIYGACAAMGNIYAESKMNPRNLETQTMIVPGWLSIAWKTPESQQNRRVQHTLVICRKFCRILDSRM